LDLRGVNLRLARLNKTKLIGADLSGANLDQAWALGTDEPLRVCRRLLLLRGWSHDEENITLFP
jgi:hypothetical protein